MIISFLPFCTVHPLPPHHAHVRRCHTRTCWGGKKHGERGGIYDDTSYCILHRGRKESAVDDVKVNLISFHCWLACPDRCCHCGSGTVFPSRLVAKKTLACHSASHQIAPDALVLGVPSFGRVRDEERSVCCVPRSERTLLFYSWQMPPGLS